MSHLITVIPFTYCDWRVHPLHITLFYKNLSRTQTDQNKPTLQLGGKYMQIRQKYSFSLILRYLRHGIQC